MSTLYAIWLHNDDVTPMEAVVDLLKTFGYRQNEAIEMMIRVHKEGGFLIAFGTQDEISKRAEVLRSEITEQNLALRFSIQGPFDEEKEELWIKERESLTAKTVQQLAFARRAVVAILIGTLLFLIAYFGGVFRSA